MSAPLPRRMAKAGRTVIAVVDQLFQHPQGDVAHSEDAEDPGVRATVLVRAGGDEPHEAGDGAGDADDDRDGSEVMREVSYTAARAFRDSGGYPCAAPG